MICFKFPAYTFDKIDLLTLDEVIELYTSAMWLSEQEQKSVKSPKV